MTARRERRAPTPGEADAYRAGAEAMRAAVHAHHLRLAARVREQAAKDKARGASDYAEHMRAVAAVWDMAADAVARIKLEGEE